MSPQPVASPRLTAPIRVVGERPPAFPLRLALADGREIDFDADPFPLVNGDKRSGLATRIVATCARRDITFLTGWTIDPDGARIRSLVECAGILWVDDRRDLVTPGEPTP